MKTTLLYIILLLTSCTFNEQQETNEAFVKRSPNKVIRIADGDTFTVLHVDNKQERIRLYGIDAPEQGQDFGEASKKALSDLVFGKQVRIESKGIDKHSRTIAIIYTLDGICVNEELLKSGMVWHFKQFDKNPDWAAMETHARNNKRGLWSKSDAVAPSSFRTTKPQRN